MTTVMKRLIIVFGLSQIVTVGSASAEVCDEGQSAYQATTFDLVQNRSACIGCHAGSNQRAPAWAISDLEQSYVRAKGFVNFADIAQSKLVIRSGNGHCGPACQKPAFKAALIQSIEQWWQQGEQKCQTYLNTEAVALPANISATHFQPITWNLSAVSASLSQVQLQADIKGITSGVAGEYLGYIVRNLNVLSSNQDVCLHVQNMRVLVNGKPQWFANAYEAINAKVDLMAGSSGNLKLSTEQVVLEATSKQDQLSIGFRVVELLDRVHCGTN